MSYAGSTAGQPTESQNAAAKPQAMRLEYVQHPQDESSDAAVHFVLAPSYVTYNAVTIQHVQDFFKTEEVWPNHLWPACLSEPSRITDQLRHGPQSWRSLRHATSQQCAHMQVMDFSALGAQAVARVESAQRAARDQLIAAMNQRPKLSLKLELEGPKIAVPVPASGSQGEAQGLLCRLHPCYGTNRSRLPNMQHDACVSDLECPHTLDAQSTMLAGLTASAVPCRQADPGGRPGIDSVGE